MARTIHGHAKRKRWTPEFRAWHSMRERCSNQNNPSYHNYGGRGISVCARWATFVNFISDMGLKPSPKHSLNRIDNDGNYEPGNCEWATKTKQDNNRRTNKFVSFNGQTHTVADWARLLNINYVTLVSRFRYGWPIDRILNPALGPIHTAPVGQHLPTNTLHQTISPS